MEQNNLFRASFYSFLKNKLKGTETSVVQETKTSHQLLGFINTQEISKLKTEEVDTSIMILFITVHWEQVQHCSTMSEML